MEFETAQLLWRSLWHIEEIKLHPIYPEETLEQGNKETCAIMFTEALILKKYTENVPQRRNGYTGLVTQKNTIQQLK